jgi:hypothetical protein
LAVYIALLRGINVGGAGILSMKDLAAMCGKLGFAKARTYIQSGNVIFECGLKEDAVRRALEEALQVKMSKKIDVMVRTSTEMRATLEANPFPNKEANKVAVAFFGGQAACGGTARVDWARWRAGACRQAGSLRLLPGRDGPIETEASSGRSGSHGTQYQHRCEAD